MIKHMFDYEVRIEGDSGSGGFWQWGCGDFWFWGIETGLNKFEVVILREWSSPPQVVQ